MHAGTHCTISMKLPAALSREDGREPALNPPCDQSALPEVLAAIKAQIRPTRERVCSSEKARSIAPRADSCCGCANDSLLVDRANSGRRSSAALGQLQPDHDRALIG